MPLLMQLFDTTNRSFSEKQALGIWLQGWSLLIPVLDCSKLSQDMVGFSGLLILKFYHFRG